MRLPKVPRYLRVFGSAVILALMNGIFLVTPILFPDYLKIQPGKPLSSTVLAFLLGVSIYMLYQLFPSIKEYQSDPEKKARSDFFRLYSKTQIKMINLIQDLADLGIKELEEIQRNILLNICSIVRPFYGNHQKLKINANIMLAVPVEGKRIEDFPGLQFLDPHRDLKHYNAVLVTTQWAEPDQGVPQQFCLPIDKDPNRVLFGAPKAFVDERVKVIGNIKDKGKLFQLMAGQPDLVKKAVWGYLNNADSFASFASWCLKDKDGTPIGVLNIQSNRKNIFGVEDQDCDQISQYVEPLCSMLTLVIKETKSRS